VPFTPVGGPAPLAGTNYTIAFQGSRPGLQPQEADTWSVGVDLTPMDGLRVSANYYNVKFTNILGTPTPGSGIFTEFPNNVLYNINGISSSAVTSFLTSGGSAPLSAALASQLNSTLTSLAGARIAEVVDFRVGNFGILRVQGIDFSMNYRNTTDWGGVDVGMNFNAPLKRERQASSTAAIADELQRETSKLQLQTVFGVDVGAFRAQATWSHSAGYAITPTSSNPIQSRVGSFSTLDLFFKYDVPGDGMFKDLSFTLNVKNVGDKAPPVLLRNQPNERGFANGFSIGRMFIFGASKKF
jgi:iron complex outermembrane receptor protein